MKTMFYRVILSILCGFTLTITSCSDNDDNATPLSAPEDIKYTEISSNSFTVTWATTPNATCYVIKIKDEWGELTEKSQTVSDASVTFTGLDSEMKYWVSICSVIGNTSSPFSRWLAVKMPEGTIAKAFASGGGIKEYPFVIKTMGQLKLMAYLVNKANDITNGVANPASAQTDDGVEMDPTFDYTKAYYELGDDIDMSGVSDWTPIGTGADNENIAMPSKNMFKGQFDGKGHTVRNFTINYSSNNTSAMCGLFGMCGTGSSISNLNVEGNLAAIQTGETGANNCLLAGGITAYNYGATISNCSFTGSIRASYTKDLFGRTIVGGICGSLAGNITECIVKVPTSSEITGYGSSAQVGGIAGYGNQGTLIYSKVIIDGKVQAETKPLYESEDSYSSPSAFAGGLCASSLGTSIGACEVTVNGTIHAKSRKTSEESQIITSANAGGISGYYGADMLGNCNITIKGSIKAEANNLANAGGAVGSQKQNGYGCTAIHITISGEISATNYSNSNTLDAAYAGGIYGTGSFQRTTAGIQDCDAILTGKIMADSPQIAMAGGIGGSAQNLTRCWVVIDKTGTIEAKGGTAGASCGGLLGNLLTGSIYASYTICKGTLKSSSETAGRNPVNLGGITGAAQGTKIARKSIIGSYSLIEGTFTATGTNTFVGGVTGSSNTDTTLNSIYWWSASDALKSHTGVGAASNQFKLQDMNQTSQIEAAQDMNVALESRGYGYYFYREKDGYLNITTII